MPFFSPELAAGGSALPCFAVPIWYLLVTSLNQAVADLFEPQVGAVLSQPA